MMWNDDKAYNEHPNRKHFTLIANGIILSSLFLSLTLSQKCVYLSMRHTKAIHALTHRMSRLKKKNC